MKSSGYTYISLLKSVADDSLVAGDFQHVGRGTVKRKLIKIISNYLAYTIISKVVFDHCTTTDHRRDWEPQNSLGESQSHTHITDGSKEEKGTLSGAPFSSGGLITGPTQFI